MSNFQKSFFASSVLWLLVILIAVSMMYRSNEMDRLRVANQQLIDNYNTVDAKLKQLGGFIDETNKLLNREYNEKNIDIGNFLAMGYKLLPASTQPAGSPLQK